MVLKPIALLPYVSGRREVRTFASTVVPDSRPEDGPTRSSCTLPSMWRMDSYSFLRHRRQVFTATRSSPFEAATRVHFTL